MTTSTIAQLKSSINEICTRWNVPATDFINEDLDKRFKSTWELAFESANNYHISMLKTEQEKSLATEIEDVEVNKEDGNMEILNKQVLANTLANEIFENKGFSLWFDSELRATGYSVGNNTFSYQIPNIGNGVGGFQTYEYYDTVTEALTLFMIHAENLVSSGTYDCDGISGWLDEESGTLYLDPVCHIDDLGDALELALTNKELAIYAIASGICYNVHGEHNKIDDSLYYVEAEPSEISDNFLWYRVCDLETDAVIGYVS